YPRVRAEMPLRPRFAPRPPAGLAGVQHATPPRRHHGPDGRARRAARVHRHDDRRRDLVRSARTRLAAVPARDLAESRNPTVQGAVQRGPPPPRPDPDGEHPRPLDRGVPRVRVASRRGPGLVADGVDPGRHPGPRGRVVALPAPASDRTGGPRGRRGMTRVEIVPATASPVTRAKDARSPFAAEGARRPE